MKIVRHLPLVLLLGLATGCSTAQPRPQPTYLPVPGTYTNSMSRMVFPELVGSFMRGDITQFDTDGRDVGVGYDYKAPASPVFMTVYVYPAPRVSSLASPPDVVAGARQHLFDSHFEGCKQDITIAHPDAKAVSEGPFALVQGGSSHNGREATYRFALKFPLGQEEALSSLYLFQLGDYFVKYRVTYPAQADHELKPLIDEFMQTLPLPRT